MSVLKFKIEPDFVVTLETEKFKSKPTGTPNGQGGITMNVRGYLVLKEQLKSQLLYYAVKLDIPCATRIRHVDTLFLLRSRDRDLGNLLNALLDVGTGILWTDDRSGNIPSMSSSLLVVKSGLEKVRISVWS